MTRLPMLLLLAAAFGVFAAPEARGNPKVLLTVRAVDARTGTMPRRMFCALLEPGARTPYAEIRGHLYSGPRVPKAGDLLYVYGRHCDPARVRLDGPGVVDIRLRPARVATVALEERAAHVAFWVGVSLKPGTWTRERSLDQYPLNSEGGTVRVPCPHGMHVHGVVQARGAVVYPLSIDLQPGRRHELKALLPRVLRVDRDPPFSFDDARFLVDMAWQPRASEQEIDAWLLALRLPLQSGLSNDGTSMRLVPDVPFHVFAVHRKTPLYRYVGPGAGRIALRGPFRLKRVARRPKIDGKPAPAGTLMGPGRLTAIVLADVGEDDTLKGCVVRLGPKGRCWSGVELPSADWLTLWHPEIGLAHVRWVQGKPPAGRTYPGTLELRFPEGVASGHVGYLRTWKSSGRTRSAVLGMGPRARVMKAARLTIRGLAPGTYTVDPHLTIETADGEPVGRVRIMRNVEIPADKPNQVKVVRVDR